MNTYKLFKQRYFNTDNEYRLYITRFGIGPKIAFCLALVNLYNLRQTIIKHSIWMTGSNNPGIVLAGCLLVGGAYSVGLTVIWMIPSISLQSGVRFYDAISHITLNRFSDRQSILKQVLND